ncbi:MAG TPA: imidazolonepropionase [Candidatus Marinimicrobia bacterium]|nr:imidazolonepropionase [Candidatus Neomarinimicrobiota bacterium]
MENGRWGLDNQQSKISNPKSIILKNIGCLVTANADGLASFENTSILIENGKIAAIGEGQSENAIDCGGKMVTCGFVDSHTHPVFLDNRDEEYAMRLAGATYEKIAEKGGGIVSSVEGVRNASEDELIDKVSQRMDRFIAGGTTTIEAKSGYGLDTESELKSLSVIHKVHKSHALDLIPTFMGGHAFPQEFADDHDGYVNLICNEMIPAVAAQGIAVFNDVFCEEGYFTVAQSKRILETGKKYGLKPRLHADEFVDSGAAELAGEVGAISADHLMAVSADGINALVENNVIATLLPGTTFFLGKSTYAPARELINSGITLSLATDFNPGSCYIQSMPFIMTLACMHLGMTVEESFQAVTYYSAKALELEDKIGSIEVGKSADLIVWGISSLLDIPYYVSNHPIRYVMKNGEIVFGT